MKKIIAISLIGFSCASIAQTPQGQGEARQQRFEQKKQEHIQRMKERHAQKEACFQQATSPEQMRACRQKGV
jgi:hypothetical protein